MHRQLLLAATVLMAACSGSGSAPAPAAAAPAHVNGTVEGTYRVSGQDVKINYVFVAKGDHPYENQPTYDIVFSEKDASAEADTFMVTLSENHGALLYIKEYKDGDTYSVISESYHHPGLQQKHPGCVGRILLKNVTVANGEIRGEAYTKPGEKIFDQPVEIDLKFKAPMPP